MIEQSTEYRLIKNTKYVYRIGDMGDVQKLRSDDSWQTLKPYSLGVKNRLFIKLVYPEGRRAVAISRLMDECFFDGYATKNNLCISYKNGINSDCSRNNLLFTTHAEMNKKKHSRGKRVIKMGNRDQILATYPSIREAARYAGVSTTAMIKRLRRTDMPYYNSDGSYYIYAEELDNI